MERASSAAADSLCDNLPYRGIWPFARDNDLLFDNSCFMRSPAVGRFGMVNVDMRLMASSTVSPFFARGVILSELGKSCGPPLLNTFPAWKLVPAVAFVVEGRHDFAASSRSKQRDLVLL
jgi:hypothetical protein